MIWTRFLGAGAPLAGPVGALTQIYNLGAVAAAADFFGIAIGRRSANDPLLGLGVPHQRALCDDAAREDIGRFSVGQNNVRAADLCGERNALHSGVFRKPVLEDVLTRRNGQRRSIPRLSCSGDQSNESEAKLHMVANARVTLMCVV